MTQKSTKLLIPHSFDLECTITGILEQVDPEQDTHGRKIALVCFLNHNFALPIFIFFEILHGTLGSVYWLDKK